MKFPHCLWHEQKGYFSLTIRVGPFLVCHGNCARQLTSEISKHGWLCIDHTGVEMQGVEKTKPHLGIQVLRLEMDGFPP